MRKAPLTDSQKTDKGLYGPYVPRVRGRGVTAQSKDGSRTRRGRGGAAMNPTATELEFTWRRAMRAIVKVFAAALLFLGVFVSHSVPALAFPIGGHPDKCKGGVPDGAFSCINNGGEVLCTNDGDYMCCTKNAQGGRDCEQIETLRRPQGGLRPDAGGVPPAKQPPANVPPGKMAPSPVAPQRVAPGVFAPSPSPQALPGQFLIQTSRGYYLTAVEGGGRITNVVHTDATQIGSWEKFRLVPYPQAGPSYTPGSFAIRTGNGRNYLTAVGGGGRTTDVVHTDATQIGSWEKFSLQVLTTPGVYGAYAIWTGNGRNYLTATGGGGHNTDPPAVHTDATKVGSWETFWLLASGDPGSGITYRISTRPGSYLIANRGGGQTTNAIGDTSTIPYAWNDENTRFRPIRQGDGTYALQTIDGHFVTAVGGGGRTTDVLHTDATQVQAWEKFWLRDQGNGTYTIQTVKGNYLGPGPEVISTNIGDLNSAYKFRLIMYNF